MASDISVASGRVAYAGRVMNRAARVLAATKTGQTWASAAAWEAASQLINSDVFLDLNPAAGAEEGGEGGSVEGRRAGSETGGSRSDQPGAAGLGAAGDAAATGLGGGIGAAEVRLQEASCRAGHADGAVGAAAVTHAGGVTHGTTGDRAGSGVGLGGVRWAHGCEPSLTELLATDELRATGGTAGHTAEGDQDPAGVAACPDIVVATCLGPHSLKGIQEDVSLVEVRFMQPGLGENLQDLGIAGLTREPESSCTRGVG